MKSLSTLLLGAALLCCAAPLLAAEHVYYVGLDIRLAGQDRGTFRQRSLSSLASDTAADGSTRLRTRILWSEQQAPGDRQTVLDLDPEVGDERAMLALLDGGFELTVAADGTSTGMRAVDQEAWRDTVTLQPQAARLINAEQQLGGLQPLALPAQLDIGQRITRRAQTRDFGELTSQMQVQSLTPAEVVVSVELAGTGVQGHGRQVLQRADGMPIEARMHLTLAPRDDLPATEQQMYLARMDLDPLQRLETESIVETYPAMIQAHLDAPPFSALSSNADDYPPAPPEERVPGLLDMAALKQTEASLMFAVNRDYRDGRPLIRIAGRVGTGASTRDDPAAPAIAAATPRAVHFFDAKGKRLSNLTAQPVLDPWVLVGDFHADEKDIAFPFRLPLNTRGSQVDAIRRIRLDVDVDTYLGTEVETLAPGTPSRRNPNAQVQWTSPTRVTVEQPLPWREGNGGYWTTAVPLDAQGREMPAAMVDVQGALALADAHPGDPAQSPLHWERMRQPHRLEIATAAPIAALRLRHQRWQRQPRQWTFRYLAPDDADAGKAEGGAD